MKVSVVIPARDEAGSIERTLAHVGDALRAERISYEVVVVDDGSGDGTADAVRRAAASDAGIRLVENADRHGYGLAVRAGLAAATGDAIVVMMADESDDPRDLVKYVRKLEEGYECVFGSRFVAGSRVIDYPLPKLVLNRLANAFIRILFRIPLNDVTNAFKGYRREVIDGMHPLISVHYNLTVEMPLKALVRGYSFAVVPISWTNRKSGESKLKIQEMGSRYLFIVLYLWLEKLLSRGDYRRVDKPDAERVRVAGS